MRAVIVSHLYADPANRDKLRCLAGLGVSYAVGAFLPSLVALIIGLWLFKKPKQG